MFTLAEDDVEICHECLAVCRMSKSRRLIDVLMSLPRRGAFTVEALAADLGVSQRTALRYLHELSELGVPLAARPGPGGGYALVRDRVLPGISFTIEEAVALFFAFHALRSYKVLPFAMDAEAAVDKLRQELPERVRLRVDALTGRLDFTTGAVSPPAPALGAVLQAALDGTVVQLLYRSARGDELRRIQPIGVYGQNGLWYCPAWCFERQDYRLFRVDRMSRARPDAAVVPRPDVAARTLADLGSILARPKALVLEADLTPEGVRRFGHDDWVILAADGSGHLAMPIEEGDVPLFGRMLLSLAPHAVANGPKPLLDWMEERVRWLSDHYAPAQAPSA
jgi:predicted DNA-binding transcriptional regulator YafY